MDLDRQIFLDLDGVLADMDLAYMELFGTKTARYGGCSNAQFWKNVSQHGSFFRHLPLMPDALELWHGVKLMQANPIILTGLPASVPGAEQHKRDWVAEHICPNVKVIVCPSKDKSLHGKAGDILVDDYTRYQPLWEAMGGIFVVHTSAQDSLAQLSALL